MTTDWTGHFALRHVLNLTCCCFCSALVVFWAHTWWKVNGPTCPLWGAPFHPHFVWFSVFGGARTVALWIWPLCSEAGWCASLISISVSVPLNCGSAFYTMTRDEFALLTGSSKMQRVSFLFIFFEHRWWHFKSVVRNDCRLRVSQLPC